ncbi:MAG: hypothetical protein O2955_06140 [Planctomycetota bacterium]|nr:hypothetical protein [Planctomycetota bacterium]
MSTTLQQPGLENRSGYVDSHDFISLKLAKTRSTIKTTEMLTSLMGALALVVGYLFLFVIADHWLVPQGIGFVPRLLLLGGLVASTAVWMIYKVIIPYVKNVHNLYAANMLEKNEPDFRGNLLNLIDLQRSGRTISPHIMTALEKRAAVRLADINVEEAIDNRLLLRTAYALLALVVVSCLYTIFSPKPIAPSLWAALLPTPNRTVATRTEISAVNPGNAEILARSQFEVTADILGELPDEVTLRYTTIDRRHVEEPIRMYPVEEGLRSFRGIITGENGKGILQNFTYSILAGDAVSPEFAVTVKQPPSAVVDNVRFMYPRYMGLDQKTESGGHIDAWEGTSVSIQATANKPVTSALLLFIDNENSAAKAEEISMDIEDGTHLSLEWSLSIRSDGTSPKFYRIQCRDDAGNTDPAPTLYSLNIRPDLPPEVTLHDPTQDLELPANATVPLAVTAQDPDFMLRYVILRVEKEGEPVWEEPLMEGQPRQDFQGFHDFRLSPLNLQPGEIISFWIEAHDNKEPVANRRSTPKLNITVQAPVSEEEAQKLLDEQKQQQKENLEQNADDDNQRGDEGENSGESQPTDDTESQSDESNANDEGDPQEESSDQPGAEETDETDSSKEGNNGNDGEPKSGDQKSPKPTTGDQQMPSDEKPKESQGGDGEKPGDEQQLKSDGSDDDEALRRLLKKQQDQTKNSQDSSEDESSKEGEANQEKDPTDDGSKDSDKTADTAERKGDQPADEKMTSDKEDESASDGSDPKEGDTDTNDPQAEKDDQKKGNGDNSSDGDMPENDNPQEAGDTNDKGKSKPSDKDDKQEPQEGPGEENQKPTNPLKKPNKSKKGDVEEGEISEDDDPDADDENKTTSQKKKSDSKNKKPADNDVDSQDADTEEDSSRDPKNMKKKNKSPTNKMPPGEQTDEVDESEDGEDGESKNSKSPDQGDAINNDKGMKKKGASRNQADSDSSSDTEGSSDDSADSDKQTGEAGDNSKSSDAKQQMEDAENQQDKKPANGEKNDDDQKSPDGDKGGENQGQDGDGGGKGKGKGQSKGSSSDEPSEQPGQEGGKGGKRGQVSGSGNTSGDAKSGGEGTSGEGNSPYDLEDADAANLEDKEKAVNLVLKELEDQLKRGELDPELLKEMGWTEKEMKKFVDRMQQQLQQPEPDEATPEALAKRIQFEEMLKNLDVAGQARERTGADVKKSLGEEIGPRRLDVPPEFREAYEAYTKSLSKYKKQPTGKSK